MMAKVRRDIVLLAGGIAAGLAILAGPAQAQPTKAQQDAVRANCRSDFMSLCRGVQPGGQPALACLQQNSARLGPACKQAVDAISGKPAAPAPRSEAPPAPAFAPTVMAQLQPSPRQLRNMRMSCAADVQIHCVGVPANPHARVACLRENAANISQPCRQVLGALAAAAPAAAAPAATVTTGPAASTTMAQAQPTAAQQSAVRANCRGDFQSLCKGVQPGGQAAMGCLQQNASRLSQACRTAVSAITGASATAAPAIAPKPAPAAPKPAAASTAAAAQPSAAQQSAIRSNCRGDFQSLCSGVQPGGQAALGCLQQNAAKLSPACRTAVTGVAAPAAAAPAPARASTSPAPSTATPPAPAAAAAPGTSLPPNQVAALTSACGADVQAHCKGVSLGSGRVMACLAANGPSLSAQCRQAMATLSQSR